jgi:hypothetical protein
MSIPFVEIASTRYTEINHMHTIHIFLQSAMRAGFSSREQFCLFRQQNKFRRARSANEYFSLRFGPQKNERRAQ